MQDSKVITVKGEWGRQSSKHFNWRDARYMNMQYAISGKAWCLSVSAASFATLMSTWTYLMNKMSRCANTKSRGAINFKAHVAKWKRTKPHIRLIKNETRSSVNILTDITSPFFFFFTEFFRSLLLSFSPALDEHNPDIPEWREDIGRVVRTALSQVHRFLRDLSCSWQQTLTALRVITISYRCAKMTQQSWCFVTRAWCFYLVIYCAFALTLIWVSKLKVGVKPLTSAVKTHLDVALLSLQVCGIHEDQLLVSLYPGLPTTAELFILPDEQTSTDRKRGSEEALETVRAMICRFFYFILYHASFYVELLFPAVDMKT